jgi:regulator of nonsense transcripts 2
MFFNRGAAGKKLDYLLSFFQVSACHVCPQPFRRDRLRCSYNLWLTKFKKYYVYTKASLPMEIEFTVQDIFTLTRPHWERASNLEDATRALQDAIAQDQKNAGLDKAVEADDASSGPSSDDENGDGDDVDAYGEMDDESGSEDADEADVSRIGRISAGIEADTPTQDGDDDSARESDFDDEAIVVTRQQEMADPEDEAEFEREYAKMLSESLESRKFERKQVFDVPLPVRAKTREPSTLSDADKETAKDTSLPVNTMAFSLLTKKGNRQQVGVLHGKLLRNTQLTCE